MPQSNRSYNQNEPVFLDPASPAQGKPFDNAQGKLLDPHRYKLRCMSCGAEYWAHPFRLHCDRCWESGSLLRTVYSQKQLQVKPQLPGIFRYLDWLPVNRYLDVAGKPIVYESQHLAAHLGLKRLYICFNGYWPEKHAALATGSFKELEAACVLARIPANYSRTLTLASAGNTGRAFAHVGSTLNLPICLVVPETSLSKIWSTNSQLPQNASSVRLVAVADNSDYSDAIAIARSIAAQNGFFPEGGVLNVARRDGMGATVLEAAVTLGEIPDSYFQAVGSGTGAIAAWEANLRLLEDGRFGGKRMRLHLAQNAPFTPMVDAWQAQSRSLNMPPEAIARSQIQQVLAQVLTNRNPAYAMPGGLYDALTDTGGNMYAVGNQACSYARWLFERLEGIDISAASGVATAALIQAVEAGKVNKDECILLNITSGGIKRMQRELVPQQWPADLVVSPTSSCWFDVRLGIERPFGQLFAV